jgi:PAS domain S-box-containing protein
MEPLMEDIPLDWVQAFQQAEEVLQDSDRLFRLVWESTSDAMALSAPDGTVLAANPAYYQLYGFKPEEVIGKQFFIIFPEEQQTWAQILYEEMFISPVISPPIETPIIRADGTERFVESRYTFLTSSGQRRAMLSLIRDITSLKKREEACWVSEEKLRLALKANNMGIWDWDIVSDTIHCSANLATLLGVAPESSAMNYEAFLNLVHPQDRVLVDQQIKRALAEGVDYSLAFRVVLPGTFIRRAKTLGQVIANEAGQAIRMVGVVMDITQEKQDDSSG